MEGGGRGLGIILKIIEAGRAGLNNIKGRVARAKAVWLIRWIVTPRHSQTTSGGSRGPKGLIKSTNYAKETR